MIEPMTDRIDKLVGQWEGQRPDLDSSALDIVARVQELAKLLRRDEDSRLAELDIKMWEYDVLSALRRQGEPFSLPASKLAKEALLSSGAMTNRVDRLAKRGLVTRHEAPADRRGVVVKLSASGLQLIDQALKSRLTLAAEQIAKLTNIERSALADGLRKVSDSLQA
jgi:DNA-binding MarR family transcriptional regulator